MKIDTQKLVRYGLLFVVILAVVLVVTSFARRPMVRVVLPQGADSAQFVRANQQGKTAETKVTKSSTIRLDTGDYTVSYYNKKHAVGLDKAHIKPLLKQTIRIELSKPTNSLNVVMHQHANMVTPLGKGYLYIDTVNRSVNFADAGGIQNISEKVGVILTVPSDPTFTVYNAAVKIQNIKDGAAVITTTSGVYIMRSLGDIQKLPLSDKASLNFIASSYDESNNHLYLLSSNDTTVYSYDLSKPNDGPKAGYKTALVANRLTAGGGKVLVYYDSVPSLEPKVLEAFSANNQLVPLLVDTSTNKVIKKYDNWKGTVQAALSPDGSYLVLKKKFASVMTIQALKGGSSYVAPSSDTTALDWQGDKLYFGRAQAVWSIEPKTSKDELTYVASSDAPITQIYVGTHEVLTVANNFFVSKVAAADAQPNSVINALQKATLSGDYFFTAFVATEAGARAVIETQGDPGQGLNSESINADMDVQYQNGLNGIKVVNGQSGFEISQKRVYVTTPFIAAGNADSEE